MSIDLSREPLLTRSGIASAVTLVAGELALLGVDIDTGAQETVTRLLWALASLVPLLASFLGRKHVTPVSDPQGPRGEPLIELPAGAVVTFPGGLGLDLRGEAGEVG